MKTIDILHNQTTVSMTQLRRNPREIVRIAEDMPVAILSRNKPKFYLLSVKVYEELLKSIDDVLLMETIKTRRDCKQ
jgi:antitoxin StbD